MGITKEDIYVDIKVNGKGFVEFDKFQKQMDMFSKKTNQSMSKVTKKFKSAPLGIPEKELNAGLMNFDKAMSKMDAIAMKNNKGYEKMGKISQNNSNKIRRFGKDLRWFKMEMLGVMFFGQMLSRTVGNMLQPAADALGIFELWGTTLQVLFLPTLLQLLDPFISFATWLMDLPESTKLLIGNLTLLAGGIGLVLGAIGTWSLGKSSIEKWLGNVIPSLGTASDKLTAFQKLAIAGLVIKAIFDLEAYLEGEKTLKQTIVAFGDSLALLGLVSGKPWVIAVGLLPRLLPLGESISDWGKDIVDSGKEDIISKYENDNKKISARGLIKGAIGLPLLGLGTLLQGGSNLLNKGDPFGPKGVVEGSAQYQDTIAKRDAAKSKFNDFVSRPGSAPFSVSPNDTLIGFKGNGSNMMGGGTNITQHIYVTSANKEEISRMINDNNKRLVDDITRRVGA